MKYQLPKLNYSYNSLEPYIDAQTMEIHYSKHHQAYLNNLNSVLEKYPQIADKPLDVILKTLDKHGFEEKDRKMFKNNAGGHLNHALYWEIMGPKKDVNNQLVSEIKKEFGTVDEFKKLFSQTGVSHFGSGWVWLVKDNKGKLKVYSLPNQDSPHLNNDTPIIGLDIWEHAYYLKYQNRRIEYIDNWWNVLKLI